MVFLFFSVICFILVYYPGSVSGHCDDVYYIADNLGVQYNVMNNLLNDSKTSIYAGNFILTNLGDQPITNAGHWTLYFCNIRVLEPERLKPDIVPKPEGVELGETGILARHVQGCQFTLEPTNTFQDLQPGDSVSVPFTAMWWHVARTDIMPNWYVAHTSCQDPKTITSTTGEALNFVGPFDTVNKWKRDMADQYNPFNNEERFNKYQTEDQGNAPLGVLPTPLHEDLDGDTRLKLDTADWVVMYEGSGAQEEATFLADKLGLEARPKEDTITFRYILVTVSPLAYVHEDCEDNAEAYQLTLADEQVIQLTSRSTAGAFNGVQTLLALAADPEGVPTGEIQDCPRFAWRGIHVDLSRNFHSTDTLRRLAEAMATYKLNILHLHLADDEGWRLEIPGLEELTEIGSRRCHTVSGDDCILPQLGSGPYSSTLGSGYFTVQEYRDLLEFTSVRHIKVIPEFDMPGHSHAAIKAMEARYRKYEETNITMAEEFLLSEMNDTSEYWSAQLFTDNAINPCIESTYRFVEHVIQQTIEIHRGFQDLEIFHFGGDEVPETSWLNSSACRAMWEEFPELNRTKALKIYFVSRTANITANLGLELAGWEDGYTNEGEFPFDRSVFPNSEVYSHVWNNRWELSAGRHAYDHANAGYKVILAHATHLYFDHPHEPSEWERGYYWATRYTDTAKTFSYLPDRIYDMLDVDRLGNPLDREEMCEIHGCPPLEEPQNIIGLQAELWTETTRTGEQFDAMLFPRVLALAERAWHRADWETEDDDEERDRKMALDWNRFANALGHRELLKLDHMGVNYHLRPPGVRDPGSDRVLRAVPEFPGQPVIVSTDGGDTWWDYTANQPATPGATYTLAARSSDRRRSSRTSQVTFADEPTAGATRCDVTTSTLLITALLALINDAV